LPKATTKQAELTNNFIAGAVGGTFGTLINTPFVYILYLVTNSQDVVKSRIQNTTRVAGVVPKYNWTYPALAVVAREEGFGALYKGFAPKVLRLGPGGGVLLVPRHDTLLTTGCL
jgi:solute carrier family 25 2-oxodicarboxylate transporter 21